MQPTCLPRVDLTDDQLTARLYAIRREERQLLIEFLSHLGELDRRRIHLALGFSSLFTFCVEYLGLSKGAAFRRTTAAALLGRFPVVAMYLADGRLNLTTLVELRHVLRDEDLAQTLDRAAGKTEDGVKQLVAALQPRPEPADLLRRLPAPVVVASTATPVALSSAPNPLPAPPARATARIEPIAERRSVLRVTVEQQFVDDLQALKAAVSHQIPDGDLEQVLHHAIRVALDAVARKRRGSGRTSPAKATPEKTSSRYIPAAVREEVWRRDDGRCAFVGVEGRRCNSTHRLELDHVIPFARGGPSTVANLRVTCSSHNGYAAEQHFGADHIAMAIAARKGSFG